MIPDQEPKPVRIPRSKRKAASAPRTVFLPPLAPGWSQSRGTLEKLEDAAFMAGGALTALDQIVRAEPYWAGAWRQRLALKCAVSAVKLSGRQEGEAELRDAWCLRKPGDDPGPAGNIYAAWKRLPARAPMLSTRVLEEVAEQLAIRWSGPLGDITTWFDDLMQTGRPAPFLVSALLSRIHNERPDAEMLGWWCADMVLAQALRWPLAVPLFMAERHGAAFRTIGGRGRVRPGEPAFERAVLVALASAAGEACRLAADLQRRAERLTTVTPVLRAKGAGDVLQLLFDEDAVPGTLSTPKLTRWATRRLFERLGEFDAVRELSGRTTFRIYGL